MSITIDDNWMERALDKLNQTLAGAMDGARSKGNIETLKDLMTMQLALSEIREIASVAMAYKNN